VRRDESQKGGRRERIRVRERERESVRDELRTEAAISLWQLARETDTREEKERERGIYLGYTRITGNFRRSTVHLCSGLQ
jgi:hypothetical protein